MAINGLRNKIIGNTIESSAGGIILAQVSDDDYDTSESIISNNVVKNIRKYMISPQVMYLVHT